MTTSREPARGADVRLTPAGAAVIFDDGGRVLLTRRADDGLWCLPSGRMDVGETIERTIVRETKEETGLDVVVEAPVGIYSRPHAYYAAKGRQIVALVCVCRVVGGTLATSDETTAFAWHAPDALPPGMVPTHPERIADAVAVRAGGAFRVR